jgi:ribosomal protein S18 acetylase RimI-like enzyme
VIFHASATQLRRRDAEFNCSAPVEPAMSSTSHSTSPPTRRRRCRPVVGGSTLKPASELGVQPARLSDVPQILQLVVEAARDRHLNTQYLHWRYQIGLAKGLFATVLWRRFRDVAGAQPAHLQVVREDGAVLGFSLLRAWPIPGGWASSTPAPKELYLLCVSRAHRRRGVARLLLKHATGRIADEQALVVNTLCSCQPMASLLVSTGATLLGEAPRQLPSQVPITAYALGCVTARTLLSQLIKAQKGSSE